MPNLVATINDDEGKFLRRRVKFMCEGESRTDKSHRDECNINRIMTKAGFTGLVAQKQNGLYGDFTNASDFQECQSRVMDAINDFQMLPSKIRKRFDNNPATLLDFLSNVANRDEAIELGLIERPSSEASEAPVEPSE